MIARQFGRDTGDTYGRHALVNPGGDNRQIDVLRVIGYERAERYIFHPTRVTDNYVGSHGMDASTYGGRMFRTQETFGDYWALHRPDGSAVVL